MNIEDFIEALKKHQKCDVENCLKFNCSECEFALSMDKVPTDNEILMYFEELKDLRVKLERNSKELEAYKKALELACEELSFNKHCEHHPYCYIEDDEEDCQLINECHNKEWLKNYYLEEARDKE